MFDAELLSEIANIGFLYCYTRGMTSEEMEKTVPNGGPYTTDELVEYLKQHLLEANND
jgi:hypothetical protein